MLVIPLQSGSNGNATYVETMGVRLLFDAGISGRQAALRLRAFDRDINRVDALVISHDHADHVRCAGIYNRKFNLPVHATPETLRAARTNYPLGDIHAVEHFRAGDSIAIDGVTVHTIPTAHDGADGVAFVVDDGKHRLGILTDLGHVFAGLDRLVQSLDAVLIESNYDPRMLARGSYPPAVKDRIKGPRGHLSNLEAADLLRPASHANLQWACLAHLSDENNSPAAALRTHRDIVGSAIPLHVASRHHPLDPLEL